MKKLKFIFVILILFIGLVPNYKVQAQTLQDLYNQLAELEKKYNSSQNSKKLTESEIKKLNNEITEINNNIEKTKEEIVQAEKDIKESEKNIETKKEESNEFLKFLQISSGENAYLEYLFDAEDYTDFIYRYAVVTQMSERNNTLIKELEVLISDLETKKIDLSSKQSKLETQRSEFNSKLSTLRSNLSKVTDDAISIEEDIKGLKEKINYYKNTLGCNLNQDISSCESTPYADGWRYPLSYGCVTDEYRGWNNGVNSHYAIDLSCTPEGSPVYAAANGIVDGILNEYWCGGNIVYIYHIVNGVPYTTTYMHLLKINVKIGQKVTTDTVIGYMGGGSTAKYNGGYDSCTFGAHLHFGIANGRNPYSSFSAYSFNPRNIFKFPVLGGGYFYRK